MPEIKCHLGEAMNVCTDGALPLDRLRYAREQADEKVTAAKAQPKRVAWRVCRGGNCEGNYCEGESERVADHLPHILCLRALVGHSECRTG